MTATESPERARDFQILEGLVIAMAVMMALLGAGYSGGDTADSRLATVYSLTHHGTWAIDRPPGDDPIPFEQNTIDKVRINGHLLSSKPPMLPLLMTAEYMLLSRFPGWSLDDEEDTNRIVRVMSITLVGLAYIAAVVFFGKTLRLFVADPLIRLVMLFCLAFCTQLWGYATHINNHVPATGLLVVALYFALGVGAGKLAPKAWRFLVCGLAAGLAITMDLPVAVFLAPAGLYLFRKSPAKTLTWAVLGAAIPLGIHCAAMLAATGSVLPVQNRPEAYLGEASYWRSPQGIDALNEPKLTYLFNITFGRCGLFVLYPVLFAGIVAALRAVFKKRMPFRGYVLTAAAAFLVLTAYYVFKTNNYGGEAYGFRWYIIAMPVLLLMGAPVFMGLRARWKWLFISVMIGVSFYSAFECARSPWGANQQWTCRLFLGPSYGPILREKEDASDAR